MPRAVAFSGIFLSILQVDVIWVEFGKRAPCVKQNALKKSLAY